jgi:hypothetical protein
VYEYGKKRARIAESPPYSYTYSYTRISPLWMVIGGLKTGEKAQSWLPPGRTED